MEHVNIHKTSKKTLRYLVIKYGIISTSSFIFIFLLLKALGFAEHTELRILNYISFFIIANIALREYINHREARTHYFGGFALSFLIAQLAFGIFSIFIFFYLSFFDDAFRNYLSSTIPFGITLTPISIVILLFFESAGVGAIISLILMQYYKRTNISS